MENIHILHAELEELQKKYWHCFNNWHCDEDLEKIQFEIEELKYRLSFESSKASELQEKEPLPLPVSKSLLIA
jgi:hypothetical protein